MYFKRGVQICLLCVFFSIIMFASLRSSCFSDPPEIVTTPRPSKRHCKPPFVSIYVKGVVWWGGRGGCVSVFLCCIFLSHSFHPACRRAWMPSMKRAEWEDAPTDIDSTTYNYNLNRPLHIHAQNCAQLREQVSHLLHLQMEALIAREGMSPIPLVAYTELHSNYMYGVP